MSFTSQLAAKVLEVDSSGVPPDARRWAIVSILDTLGVAIAGASDPGVRILDHVLTGGRDAGPCTLLGSPRRASVLDAAQINGMAAHVLDFDLSNPYFAGHATMHLLAGALAAGELAEASGADFLTAYLAGFEAQMRIARALQPAHSDKGFFPSSTLGVFGVAAAAGRLLRLTEPQMAMALSIAANFSSGMLAHAGSMSKPLAAGHSARNGVLAALLGRDGFTARLEVFEHKYGFLRMFDVAGRFDVDTALTDWGKPFEIGVTAIGFKQYPCCGIIHVAIDILADLVAENDISADDVDWVEARIVTDQLAHIDRPNPQSPLDAKFSLFYCLATTIARGRPRLADFEGDRFRDPAIAALMKRIRFGAHPDLRENHPRDKQGATDVRVALKDGSLFSGALNQPFGRDPANPLPDRLVDGKFLACAGGVLGSAAAETLLRQIRNIDNGLTLKALTTTMAAKGG